VEQTATATAQPQEGPASRRAALSRRSHRAAQPRRARLQGAYAPQQGQDSCLRRSGRRGQAAVAAIRPERPWSPLPSNLERKHRRRRRYPARPDQPSSPELNASGAAQMTNLAEPA
jgi:hypothetical protein